MLWKKANTLAGLGYDEILQQREALDKELNQRTDVELALLIDKLQHIAEYKGVPLEKILEPPKQQRRKREVTAKYRDPETGEEWSGMGKPKKWLADKEAAGHSRQEFAIT